MKLLTSKDLIKSSMLGKLPNKREIQHDLHRRFIGPDIWKVKKDHVQTAASRSFTVLQNNFAKELVRIVNLLINKELTFQQARKKSKQIFVEYYKKAYFLGIKASGMGISTGYTLFLHKPYTDPTVTKEESAWSKEASESELSFWSNFIKQLSFSNSVSRIDARILMYVRALEAHYDAGRVVGAPRHSVIYWKQDKHSNYCRGCAFMASLSPIPKENVVTTPKAGMCSCLSNCNCKIVIVPKTAEEYIKIKNSSPSKEKIAKQMKSLKLN